MPTFRLLTEQRPERFYSGKPALRRSISKRLESASNAFKSESDSRRRQILSRMCTLDVRVSVWVVKQRSDKRRGHYPLAHSLRRRSALVWRS